ncbi:polysaccharide deacetylase family protein [Pseudomonas sp. 22526]|uniref:polysaccharide deacetylase family protein n=1 Tax=Pseudomonas sp. 22526 TaxID=3453937 RepID=UPI003F847487
MECSGWPNEATLNWMQGILSERFGQTARLSLVGPQCIRLEFNELQGGIDFSLDSVTFNRSDSDLPCATWDPRSEGWAPVYLDTLAVPGVEVLPVPLLEQVSSGYRIHYDVLGFTYWMLARCEEVGRQDLDEHNRFPARCSHAHKWGYLDRPLVDEWLAVLGQVIGRQWPQLTLEKHLFSIKVSHDVDEPSRYAFRSAKRLIRAVGGDLLKRADIVSAIRAPIVKLTSGRRLSRFDPSNTFNWIMDQSERHGIVSAFYFICGRTDPLKDADYELEHPAIRDLLRTIHARGHEIGLHPSYNTYLCGDALKNEAERLRKVCAEEGIVQGGWGGRMHYLRWSQPVTLAAWEGAGMTYDSTLGYAELPGFRCGTCHEYQGFDPVAQRALDLRIRPLIVMDVTLISSSYLDLGTGQEAKEMVERFKDACRSVGGVFTLLWHNSNFMKSQERSFYSDILG